MTTSTATSPRHACDVAPEGSQRDPLLDRWEACVEDVTVDGVAVVDAMSPTISELQESFTQWAFEYMPSAKWNAKEIPVRLEASGFPMSKRTTRTRPGGTIQGRYVDGLLIRQNAPRGLSTPSHRTEGTDHQH